MPRRSFLPILGLVLAGCSQTQPPRTSAANSPAAPAKCSSCHLAPRRHGLASTKWQAFLKHHRRRIRLTDDEKAFLHDFLVGSDMP
jgi:hypothetical protein